MSGRKIRNIYWLEQDMFFFSSFTYKISLFSLHIHNIFLFISTYFLICNRIHDPITALQTERKKKNSPTTHTAIANLRLSLCIIHTNLFIITYTYIQRKKKMYLVYEYKVITDIICIKSCIHRLQHSCTVCIQPIMYVLVHININWLL